MVNCKLTGLQDAQTFGQTLFWVSLWVFLGKIKIWFHRLSKADCTLWWVVLIQSDEGLNGTERTLKRKFLLPDYLQTGHWFFSCLWTQTETLALEAVDLQTRNIPLALLGHGLWIWTKSSALLDPASCSSWRSWDLLTCITAWVNCVCVCFIFAHYILLSLFF